MTRKIRADKGAAWLTVLIIIGVIAVVAAAVGALTNGFGLGGGSGGGVGDGNVTEAERETEPEAVPVIEELDYLDVSVSGSEYLYQNGKLTLDELVERLIKDAAGTRVKISDDNASKKAYEALTSALKENKISYIEAS